MIKLLVVLGLSLTLAEALDVPIQRNCAKLSPDSGLAPNYHENIAHAVHSMTVQGLRMFNPQATVKNAVPTVNLNVSHPQKVRHSSTGK